MDSDGNGLTNAEIAGIFVRQLQSADLRRLVKMDEAITGRVRGEWFERRLKLAMEETDIRISLGAEKDGLLVGALMGAVHFGEFGVLEPVAVLDTVLVDPAFARGGIATEMFSRFLESLRALRIARVRTEVDWNDHDLVAFFGKAGFRPVARLVLECEVESG